MNGAARCLGLSRRLLVLLVGLIVLSGCTARWPGVFSNGARHDDRASLEEIMAFVRSAAHFSSADNARERALLMVPEPGPGVQMRLAVLYGSPLEAGDLLKGQQLLVALLKDETPEAQPLLPLAQLLSKQYQERLRLETQGERMTQQLRDSQRRAEVLQGKLEAMAGIEAALPPRPNSGKAVGRGVR